VYERLVYETSLLDPPAAQADHERAHVARRRALAGAVATPPAIALVDESREADMARRLAALRADGGVLAVIGVEHLDAVETRLHEA
jgi:pheromone shutdown protein TraB